MQQRRPTVGPGSQKAPFGSGSPEHFPNWVRVQHCEGGKHGERGGGVMGLGEGEGGDWKSFWSG